MSIYIEVEPGEGGTVRRSPSFCAGETIDHARNEIRNVFGLREGTILTDGHFSTELVLRIGPKYKYYEGAVQDEGAIQPNNGDQPQEVVCRLEDILGAIWEKLPTALVVFIITVAAAFAAAYFRNAEWSLLVQSIYYVSFGSVTVLLVWVYKKIAPCLEWSAIAAWWCTGTAEYDGTAEEHTCLTTPTPRGH